MSSHIYIRTGDYPAAAKSNAAAVEVDRTYIQDNGVQGVYPLMYYSHNLHFLSVSQAMAGRFADAKQAADQLAELVAPAVKEMPMVEFFVPTPTFVLLRFQRWNDILVVPAPDPSLPITDLIRHFARSLAYAATGDLPNAESERKAFSSAEKMIPADALFSATEQSWTRLTPGRGCTGCENRDGEKGNENRQSSPGRKQSRCRIPWLMMSHRLGTTRSANRWAALC